MCAITKAIRQMTAQSGILVVVVAEAKKEVERKMEARRNLWEHATIVASLAT
jgi:hypothetical protein